MTEKIVFVTIVLFIVHTKSQMKYYDEEWMEEAPFWKAMYWYLKGSRIVTIHTIESEDSDLFFQFSTVLIRLLYKKSHSLLNLETHFVDGSNVFSNFACRRMRERNRASATSDLTLLRDDSTQSTTQSVGITRRKNFPMISKEFTEESYFEWYINDLHNKCGPHFNRTQLLFGPRNNGSHGVRKPKDHRKKHDKDHFSGGIKEGVVILTSDEKTFSLFLDGNGATCWNNRAHIVLLVVPKLMSCRKDDTAWKEISSNILKRLWLEQSMLNVFLAAPFSRIKDYIFMYNPFAKMKGDKAWGNIEWLKIPSKRQTVHNELKTFVYHLDDLNGYPMNVTIFERLPTLINLDESSNTTLEYSKAFGGPDGEVLATVSKTMNFSLNVVVPANGIEYGYQLENGTYLGTLGEIIYKRADIAFNAMFMKDYGSANEEMEFSVPVQFEQICVVVPKAKKIPHWLRMFQCFTPLGWTYLFVTQILCGVFWYLLQKMQNQTKLDFKLIMMKQFLMFLSSAQKLPKTIAERFFVGCCLLSSVIVIGTFQGTLYKSSTTDSYYRDINTLAELDSRGIPIGTTSPNMNNIFGDDNESTTLTNLRNKYEILETFGMPAIERAAYARNMAAVQRRSDLGLSMATKYIDENGLQLLHIIEECPRTYYLVYSVPRGSVFLQGINRWLKRMQEAGLYFFWYQRTMNNIIMGKHAEMVKTMGSDDKFMIFSMTEVQTSFYVLIIGYVISVFAFFWERIRHRVTRSSARRERMRRMRKAIGDCELSRM